MRFIGRGCVFIFSHPLGEASPHSWRFILSRAASIRQIARTTQSMNTLVTDFDGTLTRQDFYDLVRRRWPVDPQDDPWQHYVAGRITHFQALKEIFARIRGSESDLLEEVDAMELDPDLPEAVNALQAAGWEIIVASAGCEWYIRYLLSKAGVQLKVFANPGVFDPAAGLQMSLPPESPFFTPHTGVNKGAVVRDALARSEKVAFAGDGRPDLESALLVPSNWRFARGWLAGALREQGQEYIPLEGWAQVARHLLSC